MPVARINGILLHFVHVPKTGGSSVNTYLRSKGSLALYSRWPETWMRISPQHLHRAAYQAIVPDRFCDAAFVVLRDPVSRMISEYRYRAALLEQSAPGRSGVEWHDGSIFDGGFDAWVQTLLRDAKNDQWIYDNHLRPQIEFWHPRLTTFLFDDGLDLVFDWIDRVTGTLPARGTVHENPGAAIPVEMSDETDALIRATYRADEILVGRIKKARAEGAAPGLMVEMPAEETAGRIMSAE